MISSLSKKLGKLPIVGAFFLTGPKVSVLRLNGVIADTAINRKGLSHHKVKKLIDKAFDRADVAVALVINSPGGSAAQSSLIASHIRQRALEKGIPVLAFVEDLAVSGGYWLACAADKIYVQPTSIAGSIGVISASFGFEDFIGKHQIKRRVYTAGTEKSFMDPFSPEQEKDIRRLQEVQREIHRQFIAWVKNRREGRLKGDIADLFEGQFWTAFEAMGNGIVDDLGDVRGTTRERFGKDVRLIDFAPDRKLPFPLSLLGGEDISLGDRNEWAQALLEAIESRAAWSRYGL